MEKKDFKQEVPTWRSGARAVKGLATKAERSGKMHIEKR